MFCTARPRRTCCRKITASSFSSSSCTTPHIPCQHPQSLQNIKISANSIRHQHHIFHVNIHCHFNTSTSAPTASDINTVELRNCAGEHHLNTTLNLQCTTFQNKNILILNSFICQLIWPSKSGKHEDLGLMLLQLSFLFRSCGVCMDSV